MENPRKKVEFHFIEIRMFIKALDLHLMDLEKGGTTAGPESPLGY